MERVIRPERGTLTTSLEASLDLIGCEPGQSFLVSGCDGEGGRTRKGDPATSLQAAASVDDLKLNQREVLMVFEDHGDPIHDEQLVELHADALRRGLVTKSQAASGLRSRRAELVDQGFIVPTAWKGTNRNGRPTTLWTYRGSEDDPFNPPPPQPEGEQLFATPPPSGHGYADAA